MLSWMFFLVYSNKLYRMFTCCLCAGTLPKARKIFESLHAHGILPKANFVERNGLDLKGTHVGQSTPKVKAMFQEAMGGCLFIDEVYALAQGGASPGQGDPYAQDAIRTLLTEIENNRYN